MNDPHFGKRDVRAALQYWYDNVAITQTLAPDSGEPTAIPGADLWGRDSFLSDEYVEENFINYGETRQADKANELMRGAGYEKSGGQWVDSNGAPLEYILPTSSSTPEYEQLIAQQLNDFGIKTQVQTLSSSVISERGMNQEFALWEGASLVNGFFMASTKYYNNRLNQANWRMVNANVFPPEFWEKALEDGIVSKRTGFWFNAPREWMKENATRKAPPIGEPDGELQEYQLGYLSANHVFEFGSDLLRRSMEVTSWFNNWLLPGTPNYLGQTMSTVDQAHWLWPDKNSDLWKNLGMGVSFPETMAWGAFMADPENPEEGATVE
jgi:ABC-type transport system substrate-binding protein